MTKSAKTVFIWGIYLILLGGILVVAPNALLRVFGFPATNEVWIRVVGVLLLILAYYSIEAAWKEYADFFQWSVYARASVIVFFTGFVILGLAQPMLILFGAIDLLGATWTGLALRSSQDL